MRGEEVGKMGRGLREMRGGLSESGGCLLNLSICELECEICVFIWCADSVFFWAGANLERLSAPEGVGVMGVEMF